MSNVRESILETLAMAGIHNMSVDDVIAEFQASDELAGYLASADDVEQTVMAYLPKYLDLRGFAGSVGAAATWDQEKDPTTTQHTGTRATAMPSNVTDSQRTAIADELKANWEVKKMRSEQSEMIAVLIDKPYPGDWMGGIGKLHIKGDLEKEITTMKGRYTPDADIESLLGKCDSTFIPSKAQLAKLKELHEKTRQGSKAEPMWYDFDNESAYQGIMEVLTSGDGTFDVYIAPREDEGEKAYKNKAWRWNTKGYVVRVPADVAGTSTTSELDLTKEKFEGMLSIDLAGYINPRSANGLGSKMRFIKKKSNTGASAAAVAEIPCPRIFGNNPASNPETRPINMIGNGQGKMTVRSSAFYFAVRVNKHGAWSVRKMRLPLLWEQAPVWTRKPEYVSAFPPTSGTGVGRLDVKSMQEIQDAQEALAARIIGDSTGVLREKYGLTRFCMEIEERVNKNAASAAAEISL